MDILGIFEFLPLKIGENLALGNSDSYSIKISSSYRFRSNHMSQNFSKWLGYYSTVS